MQTQPSFLVHVVDSNTVDRDLLAAMIAPMGLKVEAFSDGRTFLQHALERPPSLLICDVFLHDMTALEVLEIISGHGIQCPCIILAADSDVTMAVAAIRAGAADFIEKPGFENVLWLRIRELMHMT